jgi:hypothetical protein
MNESRCLNGEDLLALLDGEASENQAAAERAHLAQCARCRVEWGELLTLVGDLRAPAVGESAVRVARVMARLDESVDRSRPNRRPSLFLAVGISVCAVAAAAVAVATRLGRTDDVGDFAARGGRASGSLRRDVGISYYVARPQPERLASGDRVDADARYEAAFRNLGERAYVLVFAVDSAQSVHWLYPAYERPEEDPQSLELPPSLGMARFPTAVVLDHPSSGRLRIVSLISAEPMRVSNVESLPPSALAVPALRERWPSTDVRELLVDVTPLDGAAL